MTESKFIEDRLPVSLKRQKKQPSSADLIRERKYSRCVVCQKVEAEPTKMVTVIAITVEDREVKTRQVDVFTKWWTCAMCEGGTND
jgi:hypothetical protein